MVEGSVSAVNSGAPDSVLSRVLAVFARPRAAMAAVKQRPLWMVAGLLVMAVMAIYSASVLHISGPEQMEMMRETRIGRMMSDDEWQRQYERSLDPSTPVRVRQGLSAAAGLWFAFFISGLVYLLFGKLAGGQGTFKQVMGVVFWSGLISAGLGTLVRWPLVVAKQSHLNVSTGPAAFLGDLDPLSAGHQALQFLDFFGLWGLVVMIIGFEVIHGFARNKAIVVTVLPWLLMSAVMFGIGRLVIG